MVIPHVTVLQHAILARNLFVRVATVGCGSSLLRAKRQVTAILDAEPLCYGQNVK